MNLDTDKIRTLSTQDMYDIISFAVDAAEDNGFVNSFILERALYEFAAIVLFPNRKDEISALVAENINTAWDILLDDGTIDMLDKEYQEDMELLANYASRWAEEFTDYLHSARGLLNSFQMISGDIMNQAVKTLQQSAQDTGISQVLEIADEWGMNREDTDSRLKVVDGKQESDSNSLFTK